MIDPAETPEQMEFDSADIAPGERFERYRALYATGSDAERLDEDFRARIRAWRLDRVLLFDRHIDGMGHRRDAARVDRDGMHHFTLTMVFSGLCEVDAGHGFQTVQPGSAVLLDMQKTMANRFRDAHVVTVSMARDRLLGAAGSTEGLHGFVVEAGEASLLFDYVGSLLRRVETLHVDAIEPATIALCALLAIAIGGHDGREERPSGARRDAMRVGRIRALVDANLHNPAFGADAAIAQSGLSRATLYRVFRAQGGVAGFIQGRRLERVRMALIDGADERAFGEIAFATGFTSESHCSRLFRERFGMRPGEYRAASMIPAEGDPRRQMRIWQDEVR